jgi:hypothetical protein
MSAELKSEPSPHLPTEWQKSEIERSNYVVNI